MSASPDRAAARARQARIAALVIVVTMLGWFVAQWAAVRFGWSTRTAVLFDLIALAAFIWSLAVTYRVWRAGLAARDDRRG